MTRRLALPRSALLGSASALALGVSALAGVPAMADDPPPYASGLTNPRGIDVAPDGTLYVAEAGTGGSTACLPNPEDPSSEVCSGTTGAVAAISNGVVRTAIGRLPSIGSDAPIGPQDVQVGPGGNFTVSIGIGQEAEARDDVLQDPRFGTVYSGRFNGNGDATRIRMTDIAAFEAAHNPDGSEAHDSDPGGLVTMGGSSVLADAGGNTLLHVTRGGHVSVLALFPDRMVDAPPFLELPPGAQIPMQAVPTAVAVGPDGAYYVSQLTGFPFPTGAADIWRVVPGEAPTVWASGMTNLTDLAWDGDQLYAVQMFDDGLLNGGTGSLVAVHPGANDPSAQRVGGPLPLPYGVAIDDGSAYVTACTLCGAGAGFVVQVPLP